jgi:hypothetical protein
MQQFKCNIYLPHIVFHALIETKTKRKKGNTAYNALFGTSSMKRHVEYEHVEFLIAYVEEVVVTYNI